MVPIVPLAAATVVTCVAACGVNVIATVWFPLGISAVPLVAAIVIQAVLAAVVNGKRVVSAVATEAVPAALAVRAVGVPAQVALSDNPKDCVSDPNESPVTTNVEVVVFATSDKFEFRAAPVRARIPVVPVIVALPITAKRGAALVNVENPVATLATLPVVAPAIVELIAFP
jgi:hypothetical protein